MTSETATRCAIRSRARHEPLTATASRIQRWVLVEQPGAWGADALVDSHLDAAIGRTLQSAARRHGFRALLIRRPGWRKPEGARRAYLVRTLPDGGWIEQLDIEDPAQVTEVDWQALQSTTAPGVGRPGPDVVRLVCTNGRHDPCCADRGRSVVRALDDVGVPELWESSHVGGDRFAANLVTLPLGVYYGRVEADEAHTLVTDLAAGVLHLDRYRGRSCFDPLTQAAEIFARHELDERRLHGVVPEGSRQLDDGSRVVDLRHDQGPVQVVVRRERAPAEPLTCGASPAQPWRYLLESIHVGDERP